MNYLAQGQDVLAADGEKVGTVAARDGDRFVVESPSLGAALECGPADVARLERGTVVLGLTRDQLRHRARPPRSAAARGKEPRGGTPGEGPRGARARSPGESPRGADPSGGERLDPADEQPQGGDRLGQGNDDSSPRPP